MTIIKCLSELIEEELDDACKYVDLAMKWKQEEPDTADLFYELSLAEMEHMDKLHNEVVELIEEYRKVHDILDVAFNGYVKRGKTHDPP